jgi:hypothetical protein
MITRNQCFGARLLILVVTLTTALACRESGPKVTVGLPKQNSHFAPGDTIHFVADLNSDVDPGIVPLSEWRWVSDIDGDLGRYPRVDTPNLSVGEHLITVSIHHKLGLSRGRVTVFVDSNAPGR